MSIENVFLEALESMVWQFAHRSSNRKGPFLSTGGLSALEEAFEALNWKDPHPVDDSHACEIEGCHDWASTGTKWEALWLHLCGGHYRDSYSGVRLPAVKADAVERESRRGPDGVLPADYYQPTEKRRQKP